MNLTLKMVAVLLMTANMVLGEEEEETAASTFEEEKYGVKYASDCEVCKVLAIEFKAKLEESSKTSVVIETGEAFRQQKKTTKYTKSELRLIETLDGICERILAYNIHKERKDSTRFAKGQSETFSTLEGLVNKGVKVDIGIPHGLWDKPSAEVTQLKTQCESMLERYEEDIEDWYFEHQEEDTFENYVCRQRALKRGDTSCLGEKVKKKKKKKKQAKAKGETGDKDEL